MGVKCVHLENRLFSELRITYCVKAGETATFQLRYRREKFRFQTGFTLASSVCGLQAANAGRHGILVDFDRQNAQRTIGQRQIDAAAALPV